METPTQSTIVRLTIHPGRIAFLRFILESYEGLALMRTLDPAAGRVILYVGRGAERETGVLLASLAEKIGLVAGLSDDPESLITFSYDGVGQ